MNHLRRIFLLVSFVFLSFGVASGSQYGGQKQEGAQKTPWNISGELEEACSCAAACPCWFASKPTRMTCGGGEVLFIRKGSYGNVPLDGLAVGMIGQSPEGQTMMESFGKWNFQYLYIDEKANPEQRKALQEIILAVSGTASPKREVRYVPITRTIEGSEHRISLGPHGTFSGHLVEGGLGGPAKIMNPPGADPIRKEYHQGLTTKLAYTDAGQKWDLSNTNYMHTNFNVTSEDYAKHAAGLAQKMEAMKKK
ncbi:MAG: DUF1326 domain-containing protein [Acidobacteria bacterium]|nr:DUF1326 domain-containing protein [Acidobacteriota bacterium]